MRGFRVLVADEDRDFAAVLAELLGLRGHQLAVAHSADAACQTARRLAAEVALLDVRLGADNGSDLIGRLKEACPGVACVVVTACADVESAVTALRHGACDYLPKSPDPLVLCASLERTFEKLRLERGKIAVERALEESEARYRGIFESATDAFLIIDRNRTIVEANPAACRMYGHAYEELIGLCAQDIIHPEYHHLFRNVEETLRSKGFFFGESVNVRKDGSSFDVEVRATTFTYQGSPHLLDIIRDISERKAAEKQLKDYATKLRATNMELEVQKQQLKAQQLDLLRQNEEMEDLARKLGEANVRLTLLSQIDPLTGLLNRRAWEEKAREEHDRFLRYGGNYSIAMIDVDHFKAFNDSRGHQAGDECLRQVAAHIAAVCRASDLVGRYGGEEFIVLMPQTDRDAALALAERVREALCELHIAHPVAPCVTISAGVAAGGAGSWEDAIRRADGALYAAKEAGRNRVHVEDRLGVACNSAVPVACHQYHFH